ncbi:MAG TPA: NUDIX domain-containing protein [Bacteroidales bacterium]|nr:NUDIX domain-containing protein [Bacteroidales bacterium]
MLRIHFYEPYHIDNKMFEYVIIAAMYQGKWLFIKHRQRGCYELPAGKVENGESPDKSAARELSEETGAVDFSLIPVAAYCVDRDGNSGYGMLYYACVKKLGKIIDQDEIAEVGMFDEMPSNLTFREIQTALFNKVLDFHRGQNIIKNG